MLLHLLYLNVLLIDRYSLRGAEGSLFLHASVAAHELIDATSGVDQLALTSVEGVRGVTDFQLVEGISLAFELDGFACLSG